jgi:phospholipase/carboxylesterase
MLIYDVVADGAVDRWIVVLHGLGDSRRGWQAVTPMLGLDRTGWIFAQAPDAYYEGWSWFDLRLPDPRPDPATVERSARLLRALLAELHAKRGIAPADVVVMGFSQGCLMALEVALTSDVRFRAVIGLSGWVHDLDGYPARFGAAATQQRILMAHGRYDGVIPIALARPQAQRLQALGLDLTWCEYDVDHGLDPDEEVADLRAFITAPPQR